MRRKGLLFVCVLLGLFMAISLIFADSWLEGKFEDLGTSIVGAKVEVDGLDFSFIGLHLRWKRMQITDPKNTMKNMIETGFSEFNMEFWPLLSRQVIIENLAITEMRSNTDRETDGKIIKKKEPSKRDFVSKTVNKLEDKVTSTASAQFDSFKKKVDVDSIMQSFQIESIDKITSLEKDLDKKYDDWEQNLSRLDLQDDLKSIESKIKSINVKKIKSLEGFQKSLKTVNQVNKSIDSLSKELKNTRKGLFSDLDNARGSLRKVDDWVNKDYARAMELAQLPKINTQNIGQLVFGKKVVDQVNKYLGYIGQARQYANKLKSEKPEKEKPPRLKGQDIYFYNKKAKPDFWIRQIDLSGQTNDKIFLKGNIKNFVSDQRLIGATTDIAIQGSKKDGASIAIDGVLNYLKDVPSEKFTSNFSGFSLANINLSESKFLPNKVKKGVGSVKATLNLIGEKIEGRIKFVGNRLVFDNDGQAKAKNEFEKIVQSIVKSISSVDFVASIRGEKDDLNFSLNSNLDDIFVQKMQAIINKEGEDAKKKIKAKIDTEVNQYREQLNKLVNGKETRLKSEINKYEQMLNEKDRMVDAKKKEVQKKIDKEKKKIEDKIKDIFKS